MLAGADRDFIGALVFPDIEACRRLAGLGPEATPADIVAAPTVRLLFTEHLFTMAAKAKGSSTRVERLILMAEPPSMDKGEATDKGSINQRAVLATRAALVEELYSATSSPNVIRSDN